MGDLAPGRGLHRAGRRSCMLLLLHTVWVPCMTALHVQGMQGTGALHQLDCGLHAVQSETEGLHDVHEPAHT